MCASDVATIFQIYIAGPLTGAVVATVIRYVMWCGCSGQHHLPTFNSRGRQPARSGRTRLRLKARVVQYVGVSQPFGDVDGLSAGGPPVCYLCDGCTTTPLTVNKSKGFFASSKTGGTF